MWTHCPVYAPAAAAGQGGAGTGSHGPRPAGRAGSPSRELAQPPAQLQAIPNRAVSGSSLRKLRLTQLQPLPASHTRLPRLLATELALSRQTGGAGQGRGIPRPPPQSSPCWLLPAPLQATPTLTEHLQTGNITSCFQKENFHLEFAFFFLKPSIGRPFYQKDDAHLLSPELFSSDKETVGPILFISPSRQLSHSLHVQKAGEFSGFHSLWVEMGQRPVCGCGFP